jgi:hypothetical protein
MAEGQTAAAAASAASVAGLVRVLEAFVADGRAHRDIERRFLSVYLEEPLKLLRRCQTGTLSATLAGQLAAFRRKEIAGEIDDLQARIKALNQEAAPIPAEAGGGRRGGCDGGS